MRRRLILLVAATTCLVLIAFLVPLALLIRQVTEDRAISRANDVLRTIVPLIGTGNDLSLALEGQPLPVSVFPPTGPPLGRAVSPSDAVRLAQRSTQSFSVDTAEGREIVVPVVSAGGTWVIRTVVPARDLTSGIARSWLVLAGLGLTLVVLGLLVADRLARTIVGPIADLSAVSHRLARAELSARASPSGRRPGSWPRRWRSPPAPGRAAPRRTAARGTPRGCARPWPARHRCPRRAGSPRTRRRRSAPRRRTCARSSG